MGRFGRLRLAATAALLLVPAAWVPAGQVEGAQSDTAGRQSAARFDETDRFYFYVQTGHAQLVDRDFAGDVDFDTPDGLNVVLSGGGGYSFSEHWGFEIQAQGTEPDLRSKRFGKVKELSNITVLGALRYRYPLGRLVPFAAAGVGFGINDINDTARPRVFLSGEDTTVAGSFQGGFDYFLAENVAIGASLQSWLYPDIDTTFVARNTANRAIVRESGSMNLSSLGLMAHIRLFPGQPASRDRRRPRRLLLADDGPFDGPGRRWYLYAVGGHHQFFEDGLGAGVVLHAPGDVNWTLGGGLGMNLDRHWGLEVMLVNSDPNARVELLGKFAEVSNFTVLPQVRYRHPLLGGRLVPFVTAGLGVAFQDVNDRRQLLQQFGAGPTPVPTPAVAVQGTSLAGAIGVGLEYFLNRHLSVAFALPLHVYPDWDTTVVRRDLGRTTVERGTYNYTGLVPMLRITAYAP